MKEREIILISCNRLIPWLSILYLLLSLDRNNIGNARLGSLEKDLHLVGNDYYTALTIFFAGMCVKEKEMQRMTNNNVMQKATSSFISHLICW